MKLRFLVATALCSAASPLAAQSIYIGDVTVERGDVAKMPVRNVGTSTTPTTVSVYTGVPSDTADAGRDYDGQAVQFDLAAGATRTVDIQTHGVTQPKVTATVKAVVNRNGTLRDGTGRLTINPKETAPPKPEPPIELPPEEPPVTLPPPGWIDSPTLGGLPAIASDFNPLLGTVPMTADFMPGSAAPDVVGAFRFICGFAGLGRFDPKVYPGDTTGKSHGHQFYGSRDITPSSTYEQLRKSNTSTCGYDPYPVNPAGYWIPWMEDGKGNVVQADQAIVYYKRRPKSDPKCQGLGTTFGAEGTCVDLPNGLFFIFGYDMVTGKTPTGTIVWQCLTGDTPVRTGPTLASVASSCVVGQGIAAKGESPNCWNGTHVDSTNHRDHVAYMIRDPNSGQLSCPPTHPYVIPQFTLSTRWSIQPGDNPVLWRPASDAMLPNAPAGTTFHIDFWPMWDPSIKDKWHRGCIDQLLNCSAGVLDKQLRIARAHAPMYPDANGNLVVRWINPKHLVPIPGPEANTKLVGF